MQTINLKHITRSAPRTPLWRCRMKFVEAFLLDKRGRGRQGAQDVPLQGVLTPLTAMMGLRTPPLAGRSLRRKIA